MLPLQSRKHAAELAVADLEAPGKQCHQRGQECRPLVFLERPDGVDDGEDLRFG